MSAWRRWLERGTLVLGGLGAGFVLLEVVLRVMGISYPNLYQPDPYCGSVLRPEAEGWFREEGASYVRISSQGLHDVEHVVPKPTHTYRIAVLGDSYAEAFQVPLQKTFWKTMERDLNGNQTIGRTRFEVINFGVSGYGTAQELLTLRHRAWAFSPDMVILAFFAGNDVMNNSRALNHEERMPYYSLRNGSLVLENDFMDWYRSRQGVLAKLYYVLLDHSRILQVFKSARFALTRSEREEKQKSVAAAEGSAEAGLANMIYLEPRDRLWEEAWEITERLLDEMSREVRAHGAEFMVVTLSTGIQVNPDRHGREDLLRGLGVADLFYPERRIRSMGERMQFHVLCLAPFLQRYAEEHQTFLHGFGSSLGVGHWNEEGHRVAGEAMAGEVARLLAASQEGGRPRNQVGSKVEEPGR